MENDFTLPRTFLTPWLLYGLYRVIHVRRVNLPVLSSSSASRAERQQRLPCGAAAPAHSGARWI
jgi:hypothetical protein